jgi:hypothetical protein
MRAATPSLPQYVFMTRCLVKHKDNFTFTFNLYVFFDRNGKTTDSEENGGKHSPNIIRVMKYRRMRYAGHVTHMADIRYTYKILVGKPEGKRPFGDVGTDGRIIPECILGT